MIVLVLLRTEIIKTAQIRTAQIEKIISSVKTVTGIELLIPAIKSEKACIMMTKVTKIYFLSVMLIAISPAE